MFGRVRMICKIRMFNISYETSILVADIAVFVYMHLFIYAVKFSNITSVTVAALPGRMILHVLTISVQSYGLLTLLRLCCGQFAFVQPITRTTIVAQFQPKNLDEIGIFIHHKIISGS